MTAAKDEALKGNHKFTYDGEDYEVPPTSEWDISVIEAVEDEKIVTVVRSILGTAQWAKYKSKPRNVEDLTKFFEALSKAAGLQGN